MDDWARFGEADGAAAVRPVRAAPSLWHRLVVVPAALVAFAAGLLSAQVPIAAPSSFAPEAVMGEARAWSKTAMRAGLPSGDDEAVGGGWVGLTEPGPSKGGLLEGEEHSAALGTAHKSPGYRGPSWLQAMMRPRTSDGKGARRPVVAVIIDDLGLDEARTRAALTLPGRVTLSFLTYGETVAAQAEEARRQGFEIMLHAPMEPDGGADPGPGALTSSMSAQAITQALERQLQAFKGYVGVNNHMGSRLTADAAAMDSVMAVLAPRGLLFVDSRTSPFTVAADRAALAGVATAMRDVFLDPTGDGEEEVADALAALERLARERGAALAIGHPHGSTISAIRQWAEGLEARGVDLVTISDYVAIAGSEARLAAAAGRPAY